MAASSAGTADSRRDRKTERVGGGGGDRLDATERRPHEPSPSMATRQRRPVGRSGSGSDAGWRGEAGAKRQAEGRRERQRGAGDPWPAEVGRGGSPRAAGSRGEERRGQARWGLRGEGAVTTTRIRWHKGGRTGLAAAAAPWRAQAGGRPSRCGRQPSGRPGRASLGYPEMYAGGDAGTNRMQLLWGDIS